MDAVLQWFIVRATEGRADVMSRSSKEMHTLSFANKALRGVWTAFEATQPERCADVYRERLLPADEYYDDDGNDDDHLDKVRRQGLLAASKHCDRDWYAERLLGACLYRVLKDTGSLAGASVEWLDAHLHNDELLCALIVAGHITIEDKDDAACDVTCSKNLPMLLECAGLFRREVISRDWIAWHMEGDALLAALKALGHLTSDGADRDWYARHFKGEDLLEALGTAGLLTSDPAWYRAHFEGFMLQAVLALTA